MTDRYTTAQRSRVMSMVHGRDTKPEMIVRRLTHSMGYRYRLHRKDFLVSLTWFSLVVAK